MASTPRLPEELRQARQSGKLAVFAGAGVSQGYPACLPGFWGLAEEIAEDTKRDVSEPLDRFLGQLKKGQIDVHGETKEILGGETSPTPVHEALTGLFPERGDVRIVTTNFDRLFTKAAANVFDIDGRVEEHIKHYEGPALPHGDDFDGIVHLHGSLAQPKRRLVLTDRDFGGAYVTRGWARDFLIDLFSHYTVLFVGYSHEDTIVEYLARGIPAEDNAPRFSLVKRAGGEVRSPCEDGDAASPKETAYQVRPHSTKEAPSSGERRPSAGPVGTTETNERDSPSKKTLEEKDAESKARWEFLGVEPLFFPHDDGEDSFAHLIETLKNWRRSFRLTGRDHAALVKHLLERYEAYLDEEAGEKPEEDAGAPPKRGRASGKDLRLGSFLSLEEEHDLERALSEVAGAYSLFRNARSIRWLRWMEEHGMADLQKAHADLPEPQQKIRAWVTERLPYSDSERFLLHLTQKPSPAQRQIACEMIGGFQLSSVPKRLWLRWLHWLSRWTTPAQTGFHTTHLLRETVLAEAWSETCFLLDELLKPRGSVRQTPVFWRGERHSRVKLLLTGDVGVLRSFWNGNLEGKLDEFARPLTTTVERHLTAAYRIGIPDWAADSDQRSHYDQYSIRRHDVREVTGEDYASEPIHLLVDIAVALMNWYVERSEARPLIERWAATSVPFLERLALHGLERTDELTGGDKLDWVLDKEWLLQPRFGQEMKRAVGSAFADAPVDMKRRTLRAIEKGVPDPGAKPWEAFTAGWLLEAVVEAAPEYEPAQKAWKNFQSDHPSVRLGDSREAPSTVATHGRPRGKELAQLPSEIIAQIVTAFDASLSGMHTGAADAANTSAAAESLAPFDSSGRLRRRVKATLRRREWANELAEELAERKRWDYYLWYPLFGKLKRSETDAAWLIGFIERHAEAWQIGHALTRTLSRLTRPVQQGKVPPLAQHPRIEATIEDLLSAMRDAAEGSERETVEDEAFDDLMRAYLNLWRMDQPCEGKDEGLIAPYAERFEALLDCPPPAGTSAVRVLVGELGRIYYLDPAWATDWLLRQFDWGTPARATSAWEAFLKARFLKPELLGTMKETFRNAFEHVGVEIASPKQFLERMAAAAVVGFDPMEGDWLVIFLNEADAELRAVWTRQLRVRLHEVGPESAKAVWEDWLGAYCELRVRNKPTPCLEKETRELFDALPFLGGAYPTGVDTLTQVRPRVSLPNSSSLIHGLEGEGLATQHPEATLELLRYIVEGWNGTAAALGLRTKKVLPALADAAADGSVSKEELHGVLDDLADCRAIDEAVRNDFAARANGEN